MPNNLQIMSTIIKNQKFSGPLTISLKDVSVMLTNAYADNILEMLKKIDETELGFRGSVGKQRREAEREYPRAYLRNTAIANTVVVVFFFFFFFFFYDSTTSFCLACSFLFFFIHVFCLFYEELLSSFKIPPFSFCIPSERHHVCVWPSPSHSQVSPATTWPISLW